MAIYPDKKGGNLTGRFRVELQSGNQRYRKRWDSLPDAKQDEKAVKAAWARGEAVAVTERAPGAPDTHTFATVFPLANGMLWRGQSTELTTWARMETIADIMGRNTRLDDIDTHQVDRLIKVLRGRGKADGTINRYLAHLSKFLKWAQSRDYRTTEKKIEFDRADESKGRIRWITPQEQAALEEFFTASDKPEAHAVWSLIQIAMETGCRRDELLFAGRSDIVGDMLYIWADRAKTNEFRTIPMRPEISKALAHLIDSETMPSRRNLRSWWERARTELGLSADADFVFHICRHTCATRMVDAGVNIVVIQDWLGHKVIETTMRYAHVRPESKLDALAKVGDHLAAAAQKARISAVSCLPHTYPTGGVIAPLSQAA